MFGVQGWVWGDQKPTSITFYLDGTAKVSDQHGRPVKGVVSNGKPVYFSECTHAEVIKALADERIDWLSLSRAGWPQLPYDELKKLKDVPPTPEDELRKIPDAALRKDALRLRRETDAAKQKKYQAVMEE